jgi:hypothetical protein
VKLTCRCLALFHEMKRLPPTVYALTAAGLLAAACGEGAPASQASPGPSASAPAAAGSPTPSQPVQSGPGPSAGPSRCHTAQVGVAFASSEGAAGHLYLTFRITNNGPGSCWLYGFVGMQMLDAGAHELPTRVLRNGGAFSNQAPPSQFTLQSGQAATFQVAYGTVPTGAETACPQAAQLIVTPPDEFDHVTLRVQGWSLAPCNGGELDVTPVRAP